MEEAAAVAVAAAAAASKRGGGGPAPFLTKTHQMVEERATDEVISWAEQGRSFVVWKPVELARDLLPLHFKHCNFSSFVRQLNTYGFRKVVPDRWEFANENFRRGEQGLLSGIRRRKSTTPPQSSSKSGGGSGVNVAFPPPLPPPPPPPASATTTSGGGNGNERSSSSASSPPRAADQLTSENEQLKKDNHTLSTELAQARRHCEELLGFLSRFLDVRQLDLGLLMQEAEEDVRAGAGAAAGYDAQAAQRRAVAANMQLESARGGEDGKSVKLFGVLLKDAAARKRGRCEEAVASERPIKMIRVGEPWVGVPSSGPGRCGGEN